jgi:hypothetical protein
MDFTHAPYYSQARAGAARSSTLSRRSSALGLAYTCSSPVADSSPPLASPTFARRRSATMAPFNPVSSVSSLASSQPELGAPSYVAQQPVEITPVQHARPSRVPRSPRGWHDPRERERRTRLADDADDLSWSAGHSGSELDVPVRRQGSSSGATTNLRSQRDGNSDASTSYSAAASSTAVRYNSELPPSAPSTNFRRSLEPRAPASSTPPRFEAQRRRPSSANSSVSSAQSYQQGSSVSLPEDALHRETERLSLTGLSPSRPPVPLDYSVMTGDDPVSPTSGVFNPPPSPGRTSLSSSSLGSHPAITGSLWAQDCLLWQRPADSSSHSSSTGSGKPNLLSKAALIREVPAVKRRVAKRESAQLLGPSRSLNSDEPSFERSVREKPSRRSFAASDASPNIMNGYWRRVIVSIKDSGVLCLLNEVLIFAHFV